jgi:hypothetical protein
MSRDMAPLEIQDPADQAVAGLSRADTASWSPCRPIRPPPASRPSRSKESREFSSDVRRNLPETRLESARQRPRMPTIRAQLDDPQHHGGHELSSRPASAQMVCCAPFGARDPAPPTTSLETAELHTWTVAAKLGVPREVKRASAASWVRLLPKNWADGSASARRTHETPPTSHE